MCRQMFLSLLLTTALMACSSSGRSPLMEQDGNASGTDATDSGSSPADLVAAADTFVPDGFADGTLPPLDLVAVDEFSPDQTSVTDVVGPEDTAPQEVQVEEIATEIVPIDIVPPGPTCGDVFKCGIAKGCGFTGDICWATCFGSADEGELQAFKDLSDCVGLKCEQLPPEQQGECLMSECLGEVFECLGGNGDADCLDSFLCIQGCGTDDGLCFFECIEESNEESLALLLDMSNATETESFALLIECAGGKGELSCGETVACFTSCEDNPPPPDDPGEDPAMDCMMGCIAQSSPEGADDLLAFLTCADEACPNGMDECPGIFACLGECPGLMF